MKKDFLRYAAEKLQVCRSQMDLLSRHFSPHLHHLSPVKAWGEFTALWGKSPSDLKSIM